MFRSLEETQGATIPVSVDGTPQLAHAGETVLALLLRLNALPLRQTPKTGAARGPFCAMGVCFDCLVEIEGRGARPSCLLPVEAGMAIRRLLRDAAGTAP